MERVVSGVRPTGHLHLGNYFGAIRNFVRMQERYDCFFFVADYHSLTTQPKPADLHANVKEVLATYLACGLNPEKTVLYVQSDIPEIPELFLLLCMIAYKGELERSTTYKDMVAKQRDNINAGLLTYPVLMAADVIIHKAVKVPVGKDQEQHLEMARNFANRFNNLYGVKCFPEPYGFSFEDKLVKIPGLDGTGKMGKSEGEQNAIYLADEPEVIKKKVMRAVTDAGPAKKNQPVSEPIQNLFTIMKAVSSPDTVAYFEEQYSNCTIRYGDLKKKLAEDIVSFTAPIRERIQSLMSDEKTLSRIVRQGASKARESAGKTLKEVREIIGIRSF
ncbi:MAG TPA: tryptophan--tRNA ligase [Chitinophagales bacterium]|nr:tryptophan--tRNA ligase [Chitinophagales bacterium]